MIDQPLPRAIPLPPDLSEEQLHEIERTVFCDVPAEKSDLLFVFGYTLAEGASDWMQIMQLMKEEIAPMVLTTGLNTPESRDRRLPQAHSIRTALIAGGIDPSQILVEDESQNTRDNVVYGKRVLEQAGIHPQSIVFFSKSEHSGRCFRTLKKYFPGVRLSCATIDPIYEGVTVSRATWRQHPEAQARVYAEYVRIQRYREKGDID